MARWTARDESRRIARPFGTLSRLLVALSTALLVAQSEAAGADPEGTAADAVPELRFAHRGAPTTTLTLPDLRAIAEPVAVRVIEPYEARAVTFRAVPLPAVLDAVYSRSWRDDEELLFTCRDGYQPGVPVSRVLAHPAFLAFARDGQRDFTISKREAGEQRRVELGPFYLVWENVEDEAIRADGDYGWPYQLVEIDLIRTRDRFPHMLPPSDASEPVVRGFRAFRAHCSRCHKINGDGGSIGQELVSPVSPLDYRDREWLERWVDDPGRIVPSARMPGLNPRLPDRQQAIDDILAYLDAMVRARGSAGRGDDAH